MESTLKILFLEDTTSDLDLLQRELRRIGVRYHAAVANSREKFEAALSNFIPDLILSDYALPSFSGMAAFGLVRERNPDVPFIIVSGTIGEQNAAQLIREGVTDYVMKDKLFLLAAKIDRALRETRERAEKNRANELVKKQHRELMEIAFLQAHQVRRPIASIQGLLGLFDFSNPHAAINAELVPRLKVAADEFDAIIKEIIQKTNEVTAGHGSEPLLRADAN